MRLILHQALKDLRAERWLVAAWLVVVAATCVIEAFKLDVYFIAPARPGGGSTSLMYVLFLLAVARVALAWVLAIRFVHDDPAEGTDAFWLTRPLSRGGVAAAKAALVVGLLLGVPAVAASFVFAMNGLPGARVPVAVAQFVLADAVFLLPLALLATVTRDLARLVLAVLLASAGWALAEVAMVFRILAAGEPPFDAWLPWVVLTGCLAVGSGVLAARQYLHRRTARTIVASAIMLSAIALVTAVWPLHASIERRASARAQRAAEPEWPGASSISVEVPLESVRVEESWHYVSGKPDTGQRVLADVRVAGLPPDCLVQIRTGKAELWVDGAAVPLTHPQTYVRGLAALAGGLLDPASRDRFQAAVGARLRTVLAVWQPSLQLLSIEKAADYQAYRGRPGTLRVTMPFQVFRVGPSVSMPLEPGASAELNDVESTILSFGSQSASGRYDTYAITLRLASPRAWLRQKPMRVEYLLRNRQRGEAIVIWNGAAGRTYPLLTGSFVVTPWSEAGMLMPLVKGVVDAAWLKDADLVMVPLEPLGAFTKTVTIPGFALPPAP